jgi:hypothetical protein
MFKVDNPPQGNAHKNTIFSLTNVDHTDTLHHPSSQPQQQQSTSIMNKRRMIQSMPNSPPNSGGGGVSMPSLTNSFATSELMKSLLKDKLMRFVKTKDRAK